MSEETARIVSIVPSLEGTEKRKRLRLFRLRTEFSKDASLWVRGRSVRGSDDGTTRRVQ